MDVGCREEVDKVAKLIQTQVDFQVKTQKAQMSGHRPHIQHLNFYFMKDDHNNRRMIGFDHKSLMLN